MSLITRCPACRTMFKVVPDQLRISEGWVRCGKCEEIFSASDHLQEAAPTDASVNSADNPDTIPFEGTLDQAMAADMASVPTPQARAKKSRVRATTTAHEEVDFELREPPVASNHLIERAVPSNPTLPEGSAYGVLATDGDRSPRGGEEYAATLPEAPESAPADLSFMRRKDAGSPWHRPLVRALLLMAGLWLVLVLTLQVLVQERDRIVSMEPGLKPLIQEVCVWMACELGPLRQIESVTIDSSAFSKSKGDVYRLSLTLKNNAPVDLAMPAVELSLTDTMDQPLLRRVFLPEELGVRTEVIPAASEVQTTLVLAVKTSSNSERLAGYRLLAFYP